MKKFKTQILFALSTIVLCFVLMVSTTLALFESEQSFGGRVQSGTLDVSLSQAIGGGSYDDITDGSGNLFGDELWEAGTSRNAFFQVENKSNLPIKVTLTLILEGESFGGNLLCCVYEGDNTQKLTWEEACAKSAPLAVDVGENLISGDEDIIVTAGEQKYFTVLLYLNEDLEDKYQDKEAIVDIRLDATQANAV